VASSNKNAFFLFFAFIYLLRSGALTKKKIIEDADSDATLLQLSKKK
jgi:hypothetical protein